MGADEVGTLKGLTERRAILDRFIGEHWGRIANTAGDSARHATAVTSAAAGGFQRRFLKSRPPARSKGARSRKGGSFSVHQGCIPEALGCLAFAIEKITC